MARLRGSAALPIFVAGRRGSAAGLVILDRGMGTRQFGMTFQNKLHCPHCPVRHPPRPVSVCGGHSITRVRCRMNAAFRRSVQVRPVFIQSQLEHFQLLRSAGSPVPHCGVQATFQSPLSYGWNTGQECPANPQTRMSALPESWNRPSFCILPSPRKSGVPIFCNGFGRDGASTLRSAATPVLRSPALRDGGWTRCPYLDAMSLPIKKEPLRRAALVKRK